MITIDFTYDVVTPQSAEQGDVEESGFITPGMWEYPDIDAYERNEWKQGDLRSLVQFAESLGICTDEGADWLYSVDPDTNYQTGADTTYAMHIAGCTPASQNRIHRLIRSI